MKVRFPNQMVKLLAVILTVSSTMISSAVATSSCQLTDLGQPVNDFSVSSMILGPDSKVYGTTAGLGHLFVLDPVSNSVTDKGIPPQQNGILELTWGLDGKLYGGGWGSTLWTYDITTGMFASKGKVPGGRRIIGLATDRNGVIYIGTEAEQDYTIKGRLFSFDPKTNIFSDKGTVGNGDSIGYGLITGSDGNIYGGTYPDGHFFVYNPETNKIADKGQPISAENSINTLIVTSDGNIYGGTSPNGHLFSYNITTEQFSDKGQAINGQAFVDSLIEKDNKIYGGTGNFDGQGVSAHLFEYDVAQRHFTDIGIPVQGESSISTLTLSANGTIFGGTSYHSHIFSYKCSNETSTKLIFDGPIGITSSYVRDKANRVNLSATVKNAGTNVASSIAVTFYDGDPNKGGTFIKGSIIDQLNPSNSKAVTVSWDLDNNIENHQIYAQAQTLNASTSTNRTASIYFADFQLGHDAYSFANSELGVYNSKEEMSQFLNDLDIPKPLQNPLFGYINALTELNGWCYGMSNSSLVYYDNQSLKPNPSLTTFQHDKALAQAKIRTYQANALDPMFRIWLGWVSDDPQTQLSITRDHLRQHLPIMHFLMHRDPGKFMPGPGTHAVVAYKEIDLDNTSYVYYYDNNKPDKFYTTDPTELYTTFTAQGISVINKGYAQYQYNKVYAVEPKLSLQDDFRVIVYSLLNRLIDDLFTSNQVGVSVTGPIDLIATDSAGRRVGYLDGQAYNEIPGATNTRSGDSQWLGLPATSQYEIRVVGRTAVTVAQKPYSLIQDATATELQIFEPTSSSTVRATAFSNITIAVGMQAHLAYTPAVSVGQLQLPDGSSIDPTSTISIDMAQFIHYNYLPLVHQ